MILCHRESFRLLDLCRGEEPNKMVASGIQCSQMVSWQAFRRFQLSWLVLLFIPSWHGMGQLTRQLTLWPLAILSFSGYPERISWVGLWNSRCVSNRQRHPICLEGSGRETLP